MKRLKIIRKKEREGEMEQGERNVGVSEVRSGEIKGDIKRKKRGGGGRLRKNRGGSKRLKMEKGRDENDEKKLQKRYIN